MKSKTFILFITCLLVSFIGKSQSAPLVDKGDKAFDKSEFQEAMYFYETALESSPNDPEITRRIANTHRRMGQLAVSAEWYRKTIELDASNSEDLLYYAQALKNLQQYEEAIYWYEMYDKVKPGDSRALSHLMNKDYYRDLQADSARYAMKSFKSNNEFSVIGITLFEDEKMLVSAVNMDKGKQAEMSPFLDVFICDFNSQNELEHPIRLDKKVNSKYHDGPAFYSFAEHKLYITRNNIRNGKPVRDKNGNVNLKIYAASYENGAWSSAQELKMNDDKYSTGHACLTKDGQTMYFVSTRDGGYGGTDVYMCYKAGNAWSEPVNLGPNVNTAGNEMFPFIDETGSLFFASDGHAGLGGLDIFSSQKKNEVWQMPVNLGAPINSCMDDFGLLYDKESDNGYFCSNRAGNGNDNLYFYKHITMERMILAGTIKANNPNISLAGERIQIREAKSARVSFATLDQHERFEYFGNAGEVIEITFLNAEYFDKDASVIKYEIPEIITDPYVNIGRSDARLIKRPPGDGLLSTMTAPVLAETKTAEPVKSTNNSKTANKDGKQDKTAVVAPIIEAPKETPKESPAVIPTEVDLVAMQKRNAILLQYQGKIVEADKLYAAGSFKEARAMYLSASAIKTDEAYPKMMMAKIDEMFKADNSANADVQYEEKIRFADKNFSENNFGEALKAYQIASSIKPTQTYPKDQIKKTEAILAKLKEPVATVSTSTKTTNTTATTTTPAPAKKQSEFEKAVPVVDLVGMGIDNVVFDYNKSFIRKDDTPILDKLCTQMKENPATTLLIRAHCDSRGSLAYNQSLSMSRAMAVQGYLLQRGIKRERIIAEWYGEQRPLNGCIDDVPCEETQYEVNRRAEFKLVNKK